MNKRSLVSLVIPSVLALPALGVAQANPGVTKKGMSSILVAGSIPGNDARTVSFAKLSNNPAGEITASITTTGLTALYGGDGSSMGVVIGLYDPANGTYLPTFEANALNSTADESFLHLSPDGLTAIFQRPDGSYLSSRASVGNAFGAPTKITGLGTDAQAALGPVGGQMMVFFTDGTNIQMQAIDLGTASLTGSASTVSTPVQSGAACISPFPIMGADGDVEGLFLSEEVTAKSSPTAYDGDADPTWAGDLDPSTPNVTMIQRTDYQCCGGVASGHFSFSHQINPPGNHAMHFEVAVLTGDVATTGGTANIRSAAANGSTTAT